jgi:hypothetical protein
VTQIQLGHRGRACVLQLGTSPLDESEVLGLDRHQQFGLQNLLAATKEKYSITWPYAVLWIRIRSDPNLWPDQDPGSSGSFF